MCALWETIYCMTLWMGHILYFQRMTELLKWAKVGWIHGELWTTIVLHPFLFHLVVPSLLSSSVAFLVRKCHVNKSFLTWGEKSMCSDCTFFQANKWLVLLQHTGCLLYKRQRKRKTLKQNISRFTYRTLTIYRSSVVYWSQFTPSSFIVVSGKENLPGALQ